MSFQFKNFNTESLYAACYLIGPLTLFICNTSVNIFCFVGV